MRQLPKLTKGELLIRLKRTFEDMVEAQYTEALEEVIEPQDGGDETVNELLAIRNDWNSWVTRIHSCTSVAELLDEYTDPASGWGSTNTDGVEELLVATFCKE